MKIVTSAPIFIPDEGKTTGQMSGYQNVGSDQDWLSADGDQFIPFDGFSPDDMTGFVTETGEVFFSANGEDFYNAEGEKLSFKDKLKKVGGFFGKVGKGIGKGAKAVGSKIKAGVQAIGRKIKEGRARRKERREEREANTQEAKEGQKPKNPIEDKLATFEQKNPDGTTSTTFGKELPQGSANLPSDQKVVVDGKTYDASNIPKESTIVVNTDANGNKTVVGQVSTSEVVGVKAPDGKFDYYPQRSLTTDTKEKSKTTQYLMWGGIAVAVGLGIYMIVRKINK